MADWTDPPYAALTVDKAWTDEKATAAFENAVALAEAATGAPYVENGWHPYNGVTVGDGATGKIYDSAVDGALATKDSPDFEDGYEYMFLFEQVSSSSNGAYLRCALYREPLNALTSAATISGVITSSVHGVTGRLIVNSPRRSSAAFLVEPLNDVVSGNSIQTPYSAALSFGYLSTLQKVLHVRFSMDVGNIDGGKIYMLRRKDFSQV